MSNVGLPVWITRCLLGKWTSQMHWMMVLVCLFVCLFRRDWYLFRGLDGKASGPPSYFSLMKEPSRCEQLSDMDKAFVARVHAYLSTFFCLIAHNFLCIHEPLYIKENSLAYFHILDPTPWETPVISTEQLHLKHEIGKILIWARAT